MSSEAHFKNPCEQSQGLLLCAAFPVPTQALPTSKMPQQQLQPTRRSWIHILKVITHSERWSEDAHPRYYGRVGLLHPTQEARAQKITILLLKLLLVLFLTEENSVVSSPQSCDRFLAKTATRDHCHSRNGQWSACMQYLGLWQWMSESKSENYTIIFWFMLSLLWSPVTVNKLIWTSAKNHAVYP